MKRTMYLFEDSSLCHCAASSIFYLLISIEIFSFLVTDWFPKKKKVESKFGDNEDEDIVIVDKLDEEKDDEIFEIETKPKKVKAKKWKRSVELDFRDITFLMEKIML